MRDWNPATFNWGHVLGDLDFEPRAWFMFLSGVAVGLCLPFGLWIGLAAVGCAACVVIVETALVIVGRARREHKRLLAHRESQGHRRGR